MMINNKTTVTDILAKTIEYEYSLYGGVDDIVLDIANNIINGFTITKIDYENTISHPIGSTYKITVYFKRKEN